jgi:alanyl-tRNA synthetase
VIVHILADYEKIELQPGDIVKGFIDEERRRNLMRHHTATHIMLRASQKVLGVHIHQAGAQKGEKSARLDIRHYTHITADEMAQIELEANRLVMENSSSCISWEERTAAEQKYGFSLYQGGVPPGAQIRVVRVAGDIEACAGTHCERTGDVGFITIIRIEHVQDGVERIEFAAGTAAVEHTDRLREIVRDASDAFSVQTDVLPETARRFFGEWKDQRKEIERLSRHVSELEVQNLVYEQIGSVSAVIRQIDVSPSELTKIATTVTERGGVAVLISKGDTAHVVVASREDGVKAGELVREVAQVLGGKGGGKPTLAQGGGPDIGAIDAALNRAREILKAL